MSTFSRKPSSNGVSTDDDHFWRSNPPKPSDYAEIFGSVASSCSIPVLDLPPAGGFDGRDVFRNSAVDYLDIFGGFEDDAFGVECEELVGGFDEERIQKETKSFQESSDVSRYFLKDPRWDNSPVSSKEAIKKLSGSTEQTNLSYPKQNSESKDSKANGRAYVEAVHAVPGATSEDDEYLSPPPKFDASPVPTSRSSRHSLVSNGDVGINFTKTVQPASSFGSTMRHGDDLYSDQKPSDLRSTPSEDASANEQYHSCSSTDQSEFDGNESLVDLSASHQCSDDSGSGGVAEVDQLKKPASPTPSVASKNYTQEMTRPIMEQPVLNPIYSGDVPSQPHIDSYSNTPSNGSAFAGDSTVQGQLANGSKSERSLQNQSTNSYNQYMDSNNGKLQGKTLLKASSLDSLTKNCGHVSENLPTRGLHHAHSFDSSSATPNDKSCHDARFLTISSVNLRTQPSKVPPPARPPPKICIGQAPPKIVKSADLKACTGDSSHFFDVEVDASSAAAASAAAMKEAMEHAQARLKSAKESMERKKENLQSRKRFAKAEMSTGKEEKVGVVAQVAHSSGEAVIPNDDQINNTGGHRPKSRRLGETVPCHQAGERYSDLAEDSLKKRQDSSSRSSQVPYVQGDRAAEWKVEEQFFELVNNEKKPEKVQEYFVFEVDKNKQKKSIQTDEEKTDKKADKLVHDGKGMDRLAVHKGGGLGDKENGFKEPREVREADKIKEVQELLVETLLQANHDELIVNLVSDQEKEIEKQAERHTSCEHDLKISEDTTTSINYGTKSNGLSESSEEKETSVQDDHAFESYEKLVNSTEDGCLHEHEKNIDSRSHTLEEEKETLECRNSIEALPVSHALETPNDDGHLVEVVAVPSEDPCDHLEKKPIPKEHVVVPTQEGETNLNGATESCDEMEPDKKKVSGRKTNESEDNADNESPPCSGTGVENATKVDSSWQYICEKIIIETQERSEQDVLNKEAAKSDSELKYFQDQQLNIHGDNKPGKDEAFEPTVASSNARTEGRISESVQKACQTVGNETEVLDSQLATASSVDRPDIVQTAEKFTEREDPEISDKNIARNSEIEERMREERAKKEIEEELERARKLEEEKEREREREKDRVAFERASREARDRAIMEARERAERAAVERVTAEARQRALTEAREKAERASAEAALAEKASKEARLRAERAAVERATAEARERAAERALAEKAAQEAKQRVEKSTTFHRDQQKKASEYDMHAKKLTGLKHSASFPDFPREQQKHSDSSDNVGRFEGESAVRCKARLERHQRTVERAAKALAEKNMRDILAQREQAERNRFAETLDADVRRWSAGKEGNLRALLSTLQYILGPDSGWQPVSLTEVITAAAVKKVYRKATLCVHPDKLQQRGASIQQKYICEKVFDLLKEAWTRFNSEER